MTDWKRQHGASVLRQLERFIENDQQAPEAQIALFRSDLVSARSDATSSLCA